MREANFILIYRRDEFNILRVAGKEYSGFFFYNGKSGLHFALVICFYNKIVRLVPFLHKLKCRFTDYGPAGRANFDYWTGLEIQRRGGTMEVTGAVSRGSDMAACWKIKDKVRKIGSRKRDLIYL